jgi:hypothetical protein
LISKKVFPYLGLIKSLPVPVETVFTVTVQVSSATTD